MKVSQHTVVTELPGVGEARRKKLEKLGICTVGDLLRYYPRAYEDRTVIHPVQAAPLGEKVCVCAMVAEQPRHSYIRKGMELVQVRAADHTAALYLTFFNQNYVRKALQAGEEFIFCGIIEEQGRHRVMTNPVFEKVGKQSMTGCIIPIYHLAAGISNHLLASLSRQALVCVCEVADTLPHWVRREYGLCQVEFALQTIHFPESFEALEEAKRSLAFEELFYLTVGLEHLKQRRRGAEGAPFSAIAMQEFINLLPFVPTDAQRRVLEEVAGDLTKGEPMNRLVQGDVGCGKTVVAAFGAWACIKEGYQAAMMAPTEVLAEQHYRTMSALLEPAGGRVALITGALSEKEKRRVKREIAQGEADLVIGTHALISQDVVFSRLALVIADEQHRFGVNQRSKLAAKSGEAGMPGTHVLVMSATPIPRTLALMVYGDLEVSVIDRLPPGRTPVATYVVGEDKRQRMYGFVRKLVGEGRQVYIVCPAVEEQADTEGVQALELKAGKAYAKRLAEEVFPQLRSGLLHGKMRPKEKDEMMGRFSRGELDILVCTTVIEVGVDVPNAALMIVENAERFGLSQLHQLRGRVGRGAYQSYCVLMTGARNPDTLARLKILASTTDGFQISEEDLKLRGPGDFFGSRQHGLPQLRLADLSGDMRTLSQAQQAARQLMKRDPCLQAPENLPVLERVRKLFSETPDIFN